MLAAKYLKQENGSGFKQVNPHIRRHFIEERVTRFCNLAIDDLFK
jgi:hypothetical protein